MVSINTGHTGPAPGEFAARLLAAKPAVPALSARVTPRAVASPDTSRGGPVPDATVSQPGATQNTGDAPAPHEQNGKSTPELEAKATAVQAVAVDDGANDQSGATIHHHPSAASPLEKYFNRGVGLDTLAIPLAIFPGTKMVLPENEIVCFGFYEFIDVIAPSPAPVSPLKDKVPYFIACTLKEEELVNKKIRERLIKQGKSTIGKQRSNAHIELLGPIMLLDDDGDVLAREPVITASGAAALLYTSHSYGFVKDGASAPSQGGRVVFVGDRQWHPAEHGFIWDAVDHLFGGGFDEHGRSPSLCYGQHARRSAEAPSQRAIINGISGGVLSVDALIELGKSLRPERSSAQTTESGRRHSRAAEIERARLMGITRPLDDYNEFMSAAAAFKREYPDDLELAAQCHDLACAGSAKYKDPDDTRAKFDEVPADYDGPSAPVTVDMLHGRAKRRAEKVLRTLYAPEDPALDNLINISAFKNGPAEAFKGYKTDESLADGIGGDTIIPKGAEPIPPNSLKPEDGIAACDYLLYCWSEKVFQNVTFGLNIPAAILTVAQKRAEQRRTKIDLDGRTLHKWEGKNLSTDTAVFAAAIVASNKRLYRVGDGDKAALVRLSSAASDPATAARVRQVYKYNGDNGGPGDPALHAGECLIPVLPGDAEAMRDIIAETIAYERRENVGTPDKPDWRKSIRSYAFKPSAKLHQEPDGGVLRDLIKRGLVPRVNEIHGTITAPVMPDLPPSTNIDDLLKPGADRIITTPGFDAASGLFLTPLGTLVRVPEQPSQHEIKSSVGLLREPWAEFPFASPGEGFDLAVSIAVAIYAMFIAANRRALTIAPGFAFSSHGKGQSTGKTTACTVICIVADGEEPTPTTLSPDFTEQRKELLSYLITGAGSMLIDNVPKGTRFDSGVIAAVLTKPRFKGRLLGLNRDVEVSTRVLWTFNGNRLNLAGDLPTRIMLSWLASPLERPSERSSSGFRIPDLTKWTIAHRQDLVAAIHTIVRAYLQECRRCGKTPPGVAARQQADGTRFGGQCEVLRDAFLWAFPDLPDPFLSFRASEGTSSTDNEAGQALRALDQILIDMAGIHAPAWARIGNHHSAVNPTMYKPVPSPEQDKWRVKFKARWARMTTDQRQNVYQTDDVKAVEDRAWRRITDCMRTRCGRRMVRSGRFCLTSSAIVVALGLNDVHSKTPQGRIIEGAMNGKTVNPVSLGRWLTENLIDAPYGDLVLRSKTEHKQAVYWIEPGQRR